MRSPVQDDAVDCVPSGASAAGPLGLPAETEAERELGVSGRGPITAFGIDRFNDYCRTAVLRHVGEWEHYVNASRRAGSISLQMTTRRWTSPTWRVSSGPSRNSTTCGLIYEAYKVLPFCWECETLLSISETRLDDAYRDRVDPAVTVAFDSHRERRRAGAPGRWITLGARGGRRRPRTLPSNLALLCRHRRSPLRLRSNTHGEELPPRQGPSCRFLRGSSLRRRSVVDELERLRAPLVGATCPLFDYFADRSRAHSSRPRRRHSSRTDEGTGIVHMAPGFGEDDQRACEASGIAGDLPGR